MNKTVSIITITQYSRYKCLEILKEHIKNQTYKNIIEWVIVEGSKTIEDVKLNCKLIKNMIEKSDLGIKIIYIEKGNPNIKLGELRNIGNNRCNGDITVCMDDDDYYPINRVEHAVEKLNESDALIAGCTEILVYDYNLRKLFKFKEIGKFHSTNGAMAWKKEYLLKNSHDINAITGEENSFTKNFTEKMIQLDSYKTIIACTHSINSFNKKPLLVTAYNEKNNIIALDTKIDTLINKEILKKYNDIFLTKEINNYDHVFFLGNSKIFNNEIKNKNCFTATIIKIAEIIAKQNKKVIIFSDDKEKKIINNVEYNNWTLFPYEQNFNSIIVAGYSGLICFAPFSVSYKKCYLYIIDKNPIPYKSLINKFSLNYNTLIFSHDINKTLLSNLFYNSKCSIIPFINPREKLTTFKVNKNPYRFCYISNKTPHIKLIIKIWSAIFKKNPYAELHLYGNFTFINKIEKDLYQLALINFGIMNHGEINIDAISRELCYSTYFFTNFEDDNSLDFINIYDVIKSNCIPICNFNEIEKYSNFRILFYDTEFDNGADNIINSFDNITLQDDIITHNSKIKQENSNLNINELITNVFF